MLSIDAKNLKKDALRADFAKHAKEYYSTKLFEEKGFARQKCKYCGMWFWSLVETDNCGDSSHNEYTFFKEKPTKIGYSEFWNKFADFFKKNKHEIVKRYPVVSRWRQDLYFTIAGIQDFQRIENGKMSFEYNANPLLVPQPCLRFKDIENVGVTGSHFTTFMMANQTAFNYPKEGYWRDRTIDLNFNFLTKVMGIAPEDIIYHEDVWAMPDFSEFGPSLEFFSKGIELGNNVFTQFELVGNVVRELENKVVDVGWGFERELWYYTGYSNAYEAAFSETLEKLKKETKKVFDTETYRKFARYGGELNADEVTNIAEKEKKILLRTKISEHDYETKIKPLQATYAVLDHTRTLLFAITDGSLPSNVGGGYNLRVLLRRSFDFMEKYKLGVSMETLADWIAIELKKTYPELSDKLDIFEKVVNLEKSRYERAKESARKVVEAVLTREVKIDKVQLRTLYESNGVTPELITGVAASKGMKLEIPEGTYADIVKGDIAGREKQKKLEIELPKELKPTKELYYDFETQASASVLFAQGKYFVLDKTPFYPEGGGQVADTGKVDGIDVVDVVDVQKIGGVIVLVANKDVKLKKGQKVEAKVDVDRRNAIIAHHTATHLISAAARKILGQHAWQEGAKKEPEKGHIDISHYDKLSDDEAKAIENLANSWILAGIKVESKEMSRGEAEKKYGFSIYQGHGVPAKKMRVVTIKSKENKLIDAEACGGLHTVGMSDLLGLIKIIGTYRIHDGIDRIEFVAGPAALKRFQEEHAQLAKIAGSLNADALSAADKLNEIMNESRALRKQGERNNEILAESIAGSIEDDKLIEKKLNVERELLIKIADMLVKRNNNAVIILSNNQGNIICVAGESSGKKAVDVLRGKFKGKEFRGGGSEKFAEGRM